MPKVSHITATKPFNVRRYGDDIHGRSVYYTRGIESGGISVGVWEGYAKDWKQDWALISQGKYLAGSGRITAWAKDWDK